MTISTKSAKASAAQVEASDRILSNHLLYCTVCDNNNGNCTVHNTTKLSLVDSNANFVADAFAKFDFFVVQDIFFSNTCRYASVVLPGAPSLEKEGTFTSTERRIQRLYQVFEPLAGMPTGLEDHPGRGESVRRWLELSASFRNHG